MFIFFRVRFNNVGIVDRGIAEIKGTEIRMMVVVSRRVLKGCILEIFFFVVWMTAASSCL